MVGEVKVEGIWLRKKLVVCSWAETIYVQVVREETPGIRLKQQAVARIQSISQCNQTNFS